MLFEIGCIACKNQVYSKETEDSSEPVILTYKWHGNMRLERAGRKHPAQKEHFPLVVAHVLPFCFEEIRACPAHNTLTGTISQTGI